MQGNRVEYRPCVVKVQFNSRVKGGDKSRVEEHSAIFHCWSDRSWTTAALFSNEVPGQQAHTVGIVEYEDGSIHEHDPQEIRFLDGRAKEILKEKAESHSRIVQEAAVTIRDELLKHQDVYDGFRASIFSVLKPRERYIGDGKCEIYAESGANYLAEEILKRIIGEE